MGKPQSTKFELKRDFKININNSPEYPVGIWYWAHNNQPKLTEILIFPWPPTQKNKNTFEFNGYATINQIWTKERF